MSDRFRVLVRVRPESERELAAQARRVVRVVDERLLAFEHAGRASAFAFDRVFDAYAAQADVYEHSVAPLVADVLRGVDATCCAYGATGSGKTHTMVGEPRERARAGVMVRAVQHLFAALRERAANDSAHVRVRVQYVEIYNERLHDLLRGDAEPPRDLAMRVAGEGSDQVVVVGLSTHEPQSAADVFALLGAGNARRTQAPTDANAESSRSHAVFRLEVEQRAAAEGVRKSATLTLIDLAGSERAASSSNRGSTMREGANINRSLLALGECINALCSDEARHVPYRNSKLTRLLQHSLAGKARMVMIATVSPASTGREDTLNTLKYANRAKNIKCTATENVVRVEDRVQDYSRLIKQLRDELQQWKTRALRAESQSTTSTSAHGESSVALAQTTSSTSSTAQTSASSASSAFVEMQSKVRAALARHKAAVGAARQLQWRERSLMADVAKKQSVVGDWQRQVRAARAADASADPLTPVRASVLYHARRGSPRSAAKSHADAHRA